VGAGVQVISLSVERELLKKADAQAKARRISRAQLFAEALKAALAPKRRRSA
jgi:metal-responsive CopG/Arc/MetJ family transcriptional regulator